MTARKLVAVLACRNRGSRLYGKPMQPLNIETGWTILDHIVANLFGLSIIDEIVLAVSEGSDNIPFIEYASSNGLKAVVGDEIDVLHRLLKGLEAANATDLFRVTTESPFLYWQAVNSAWSIHLDHCNDATFFDDIIDGCGFEIITRAALTNSWEKGNSSQRSEMCSLYIRQNPADFKVLKIDCPPSLIRRDLRLTVDYPEDLIVCRAVYNKFSSNGSKESFDLNEIVEFLDRNNSLISIIAPFAQSGYSTMYL